MLTLLVEGKKCAIYSDVLKNEFGCVWIGRLCHLLKPYEWNLPTHDLKSPAMTFALKYEVIICIWSIL